MGFQTRKAAIIGTGHVGSHCALALAMAGECDELTLIDRDHPRALAQAADLADAVACMQHPVQVSAGGYADCRGADIVLLCAGPLPRKDRTRAEQLACGVEVVRQVLRPVLDSGFDGVFVTAADPCDVLAGLIQRESGFPAARVLGTGTVLPSARLRRVLSRSLQVGQKSIHAYVMGEHGESQMVPWSNVNIGGKPLLQLMSQNPESFGRIDLVAVAERTRRSGWTVLEGKGSSEFGVGMAVAGIVRAILRDERRVLPVSTLLDGQYGQKGVYAGVPAVLGRQGVAQVLEIALTDAERLDFAASCEAIRCGMEQAGGL